MKWIHLTTAIFALLAAGCWFRSAVVKVKYDGEEDSTGWTKGGISVNRNDPFETQKKQSYWSSRAAGFAGIAALGQFISALIH